MPVDQVYDEVDDDVGAELLVDQLVHTPSPLEQDCVETTKGACVADVTAIGHRHRLKGS